MEILIQPFDGSNALEIGAMISSIQRGEFNIPITLADQPDLVTIKDFYQQGHGNFWVARYGDEVVGTVGLRDIGDDQVALRKMFVAASFRGPTFKIAQRLLDSALSWCREKQVSEILLGTTADFHAAQRFYDKNEFERVERKMLPSNFPIMAVDSIFYRKKLSTT